MLDILMEMVTDFENDKLFTSKFDVEDNSTFLVEVLFNKKF